MPNQKNIQQVAELTEQIKTSDGTVFVDYRGLSHAQLEELRSEVEKDNATVRITKNTLLKIALQENKVENSEQFDDDLTGPTATIFLRGDLISPLKKLSDFIKKYELPVIKSGYIEKTYTNAGDITILSTLISKEMLIARLMGQLNVPITNLALTIKAPINYLVFALNAIGDKKRKGGEA